jgi:hypothetical protein
MVGKPLPTSSDSGTPIEEISRLIGHKSTTDCYRAGLSQADTPGAAERCRRHGPDLRASQGRSVTQLVTQDVGDGRPNNAASA